MKTPALCVLLASMVAGCGETAALSRDASNGQLDHQSSQREDARYDVASVDRKRPLEARPVADKGPDAFIPTNYLLWQAPGGFAQTGPALEVYGDGTLHLWKTAIGTMLPHKAKGWSLQRQLTATDAKAFFTLVDAVNFAKLPHKPGSGKAGDCYPEFYYEPCQTCSAVHLYYPHPDDLKPEMDPVYSWLESYLKTDGVDLPSKYCSYL